MDYYSYESSLYLAHHGVKGQKWGERRYQNEDGTYTEIGKQRRREEYDGSYDQPKKKGLSKRAKTALKVGAATVGTAVALYGAYKLSEATHLPSKLEKAGDFLGSKFTDFKNSETGQFLAKAKNGKVGKALGKTTSDVGKAIYTAALAAVGTVAINKVIEHYKEQEGQSQAEKDANYIKKEAISAGIRKATNGSSGGGNSHGNSSSGGGQATLSKDLSDLIGPPAGAKGGVDKSSERWSSLFKGLDQDQRSNIKSFASQGYTIDQLERIAGYYRK